MVKCVYGENASGITRRMQAKKMSRGAAKRRCGRSAGGLHFSGSVKIQGPAGELTEAGHVRRNFPEGSGTKTGMASVLISA